MFWVKVPRTSERSFAKKRYLYRSRRVTGELRPTKNQGESDERDRVDVTILGQLGKIHALRLNVSYVPL